MSTDKLEKQIYGKLTRPSKSTLDGAKALMTERNSSADIQQGGALSAASGASDGAAVAKRKLSGKQIAVIVCAAVLIVSVALLTPSIIMALNPANSANPYRFVILENQPWVDISSAEEYFEENGLDIMAFSSEYSLGGKMYYYKNEPLAVRENAIINGAQVEYIVFLQDVETDYTAFFFSDPSVYDSLVHEDGENDPRFAFPLTYGTDGDGMVYALAELPPSDDLPTYINNMDYYITIKNGNLNVILKTLFGEYGSAS